MGMERQDSTQSKRRIRLRQKIVLGRWLLLAITGVSLINLLFLAFKVNYHFHLSAALPYYLNWLGVKLSEYSSVVGYQVFAGILTGVLLGMYGACWLFSAKKPEWLAAGLVMYGIDTLILIVLSFTVVKRPAACVFEILSHLACLYFLWSAMQSGKALRKMARRRRVEQEQTV